MRTVLTLAAIVVVAIGCGEPSPQEAEDYVRDKLEQDPALQGIAPEAEIEIECREGRPPNDDRFGCDVSWIAGGGLRDEPELEIHREHFIVDKDEL